MAATHAVADEAPLELRRGVEIRGRTSLPMAGLRQPVRPNDDDPGQHLRADPTLTPTVEANAGIPRSVPRTPAEVDDAISDEAQVSNPSVIGPSVAEPQVQKSAVESASWRFVPVSWSGSLGSDYGYSDGDTGTAAFSQTERLGLRANSYVWQPWFARIGGSLNLVRSSVKADGDSEADSIGVGSRLNLFPQSRFPVDAYFDINHSSTSADRGSSASFDSWLFGASNSYRPADNSFSATGNFQYSSFDSGNGAKSSQMQVGATYVPRIDTEIPQSLSTEGSYARGQSDTPAASGLAARGQSENSILRLRAMHNMNLEDWYGLTLNTEASYENNSRQAGVSGEISNSIALAQTSFNWQPIEDLPLRLNGSVRAQQFATTVAGQDLTINSLLGQVSTAYSLSPQWSASGGVSASLVSSDTTSTNAIGANLGLNYRGLAMQYGGFSYDHGASANTSMILQSQGESSQTVGASFNHGLSRPFDTGRFGPVSFNLTQTYSTSLTNAENGSNVGVGTGISFSWSLPGAERYTVSATVSGSDSRTFGDDESGSQAIGATLNSGFALSTYSNLNGNLNASFARRLESSTTFNGLTRVTPAEDWFGFGSAQVGYQHSRFFGVPRLEYSGTYSLSVRSLSSVNSAATLLGTSIASSGSNNYVVDHIVTQYLNYRLGRLSFRLSNNISIADDGTKSYSVFLSVNRDMGGVLNF